YVPGPTEGVGGCNTDLKIHFRDPQSQQPALVSSVSIRWFVENDTGLNGEAKPVMVRLRARDSTGNLLTTERKLVAAAPFRITSFTLRVMDKKRRIASVETAGITGSDVCAGFDNLAFWPPLQ